jgi:outer membrane protein OmpA-like peptidoglycan-associated protein
MKKKLYLIFIVLTLIGCTRFSQIEPIPKGMAKKKMLIVTEPTNARIFINDKYLGKSPIKTYISYSEKHFINIKAEPLFDHQIPQNIFLRIPPIPDRISIYMHHKTRAKVEKEEEEIVVSEEVFQPQNVLVEVSPDTIYVDQPIVMPIIYFSTDSFEVSEKELPKVRYVADLLEQNQQLILHIYGQADERGNDDYNLQLSLKRAQSIMQELVRLNISENRLSVYSRGRQKIINKDGQPLEWQQNRTVEFQLEMRE